jgi:hypothetical protein
MQEKAGTSFYALRASNRLGNLCGLKTMPVTHVNVVGHCPAEEATPTVGNYWNQPS